MTEPEDISEEFNDAGASKSVSPPRTVSGRVLVVPFLVFIGFCLFLTLSIALRFQAIMNQLNEVRALWPEASVVLETVYTQANSSIAASAEKTNAQTVQSWTAQYQSFLESSQYDRQVVHAIELESILDTVQQNSKTEVNRTAEPALVKLLEAEQKRRNLEGGLIGKLTIGSLRLRLPPSFQIRT